MNAFQAYADRRRSALIVLASVLGVLAVSFFGYHFNYRCLSIGLDGVQYRSYLASQWLDRLPFSQLGVDATQGNFDAYFPLFYEYLLPHAWARFVWHAFPSDVTIYFVYGIGALIAIFVCARAIGFSQPTALASGFLYDTLALPGIVNQFSEFGTNFHSNPYWAQDGIACFLMIAAFWTLGGRQIKSPTTWLLILFFPLCLTWTVVSTGAQIIFIVPATALYGGAALFDGLSWRNNAARLLAVGVTILVAIGTGQVTYYYGLLQYNAYNFFSSDFMTYSFGWREISTFFRTWVGSITVVAGIAGATLTAIGEPGRKRIFAVAHLIATCGQFVIGYILIFGIKEYHGSIPAYFEMFSWPVALIFTAHIIMLSSDGAARAFIRKRRATGHVEHLWPAEFALFVMLAIVFFYDVAVVLLKNPAVAENIPVECRTNVIRPTAITDRLAQDMALSPGKPFEGIVATVDGVQGKPSVDWIDLFIYDRSLETETGNDHRYVGLWKYKIPTMFENFSFITPPYYLVQTEFLARRQDRQVRGVIALTQIDEKMMRLWGIRYVITDQDSRAGRPVAQIDRAKDPPLRLIEFSNVNLGDYSPINVMHMDDFGTGLAALRGPSFDPEQALITDGFLAGPFVPASEVQLTYETYGFHIAAKSAGRSLLVLPAQYSHCWTVDGTGSPGLFRADLMQLGVSFSGTLNARLVFRFGPILASQCRLDDLHDMERLRISQARTAQYGSAH